MKRSWARSYYNYASCAVNFGTCFLTDRLHFFLWRTGRSECREFCFWSNNRLTGTGYWEFWLYFPESSKFEYWLFWCYERLPGSTTVTGVRMQWIDTKISTWTAEFATLVVSWELSGLVFEISLIRWLTEQKKKWGLRSVILSKRDTRTKVLKGSSRWEVVLIDGRV